MGATLKAVTANDDPDRDLFSAIGRFLSDHHLSADPANYAFAHRLLSDPTGPLARTVAELTDGGVRLTAADVVTMDGVHSRNSHRVDPNIIADRAEHQLRDVTALVTRLQTETSGFGRDLAESVDALEPEGGSDIVRLTTAMLARVRIAETRLEEAHGEAEKLREELERARGDARSDSLTGLPNRRALLEDFAERMDTGAPLCLAVCDIDHFKRINDRFGHPIGDRVLRAIAGALAETCGGAFVTRYGGEEFAVLFSDGGLDDAVATLDRARATIAAKRYKVRDDDTPLGAVTFSAGVVSVAPGEQFDSAFDRADGLLYAAKSDGRNRVRR